MAQSPQYKICSSCSQPAALHMKACGRCGQPFLSAPQIGARPATPPRSIGAQTPITAIAAILFVVVGVSIYLKIENNRLSEQLASVQAKVKQLDENAPLVHFSGNERMMYGSGVPQRDTSNWTQGDWDRYNQRLKQDAGVMDSFRKEHPGVMP
jgi:hypothetical protein